MNLQLFALDVPPANLTLPREYSNTFNWKEELSFLEASQTNQLDIDGSANERIVKYSSGASSLSEFMGYSNAKKNICVCILDTSKNVRRLIAGYVSNGHRVLVDSGAFRAFRQSLKGGASALNFDTVFKLYDEIVKNATSYSTLTLVMPDVVGDQLGSLQLLQQYRDKILQYIKLGLQVLVPVQKGYDSLTEHYNNCVDVLGTDQFVVGLPSNAKAVTPEEVALFVKQVKPGHVHFLGMKETNAMHRAIHASPFTSFSSDATQFRKFIGKGKLLTEMQQDLTDNSTYKISHDGGAPVFSASEGNNCYLDETEILGDVCSFLLEHTQLISTLASRTNTNETTIRHALALECNDTVWECLNDGFGYAENIVLSVYQELIRSVVSPAARVHSITVLAKKGLI